MICVFLIISLSSSLVIILWGSTFNLHTTAEKIGAGVLMVLGIGFLFLIPVFSQTLWLLWSKRYSDNQKLNPNSSEIEQRPNGVSTYDRWNELNLRRNLNYQTRHKPLLGIVGDVNLLFQSLPELGSQTWVETPDAFFIDLRQGTPPKNRFYKAPIDAVLSVSSYDHLSYAQIDEVSDLLEKIQWNVPIYLVGLDNQTDMRNYECCVSHVIDLEKLSKVDAIPTEWIQPFSVYITQMLEHDIRADFFMRLQRFFYQHQQEILVYFQYAEQRLHPTSLMQRWLLISADNHRLARNIVEGIGTIPRGHKKTNTHWNKVYWGVSTVTAFLCASMLYSFFQNSKDIESVNKQFAISQQINESNQIQILLEWQVLIQYLEQEHNDQNFFSFGMNKQLELLQFAKKNYGEQVKGILMPALNQMAETLGQLNKGISQKNKQDDIYYDTLKAYLMLTEQPEKTENPFLNKMLNDYALVSKNKRLQPILKFYADHLAANTDWKLKGDEELTSRSRRNLIHLIGITQADEQVYREIMLEASQKYPELTLADLIQKDYRGIWSSNKTLPGIYTDKAWNEYIKSAFENASQQKGGSGDWVLATNESDSSKNITEEKLKEYYFSDYRQAWYRFLNGITWSEQTSLQDTAAQLQTYSDPQNSPLLALFAVIKQNSHPAEQKVGLADSMAQALKKQINTLGNNAPTGTKALVKEGMAEGNKVADEEMKELKNNFASPVKGAFSPLVQLVDPNENPTNELSLQRYLERIAVSEQKLKQIYQSDSADAAAKQAVQSVLTGNNNEFTEGNRYAKLIETSLGNQLAPFAQQVFVQPFHVSWMGISTPAQRNINELWQKSVVESWQKDFSGRYPFANTDSEIAIPLLAKYLEPQQGLIDQFIQQQLSGVVTKQGDKWVATSGQIMHVNPEFLERINQLKVISQDLFFQGDTGYLFELKPIPTAHLVRYHLQIDGQSLEYFNQKAQWQSFKWPGDMLKAGTRITWESDVGGLQKEQEFNGRWGFIRLLAQAKVTPVDKSTYLLEWHSNKSHVIRFYLRSTAGKGPLSLLDLKNTPLPETVLTLKGSHLIKTKETGAVSKKSKESKEIKESKSQS